MILIHRIIVTTSISFLFNAFKIYDYDKSDQSINLSIVERNIKK